MGSWSACSHGQATSIPGSARFPPARPARASGGHAEGWLPSSLPRKPKWNQSTLRSLNNPPTSPMIFSAPHGKLRCSTYQGETNILELLDFSSGRRSDLSVVCQITYRLGLVWRFCTVCLNNMWSAVSVCQSNPVQKSNTRRKQTRKQKTTHIPVGKAGSWISRRPVNQQLEITALRWVQTPHEANSPITGSTKGD